MLSTASQKSWSEASVSLLPFVLDPRHWVYLPELSRGEGARPGLDPRYQRVVESVRVCCSVDVSEKLQSFLRIGFFAPGLSPTRASEMLAGMLKGRIALLPNQEWQVEVDTKKWIHFIRRYTAENLKA